MLPYNSGSRLSEPAGSLPTIDGGSLVPLHVRSDTDIAQQPPVRHCQHEQALAGANAQDTDINDNLEQSGRSDSSKNLTDENENLFLRFFGEKSPFESFSSKPESPQSPDDATHVNCMSTVCGLCFYSLTSSDYGINSELMERFRFLCQWRGKVLRIREKNIGYRHLNYPEEKAVQQTLTPLHHFANYIAVTLLLVALSVFW